MLVNAQATISRPNPVNTEKKWFEILVKLCMEYGLLIPSIQFCPMACATVNVHFLRRREAWALSSISKNALQSFWKHFL